MAVYIADPSLLWGHAGVSFIGSFVITYQLAGSMASMDMEEFTQELILRSLEASVPIYLISGLQPFRFLSVCFLRI